jgi:hypothetical protein
VFAKEEKKRNERKENINKIRAIQREVRIVKKSLKHENTTPPQTSTLTSHLNTFNERTSNENISNEEENYNE